MRSSSPRRRQRDGEVAGSLVDPRRAAQRARPEALAASGPRRRGSRRSAARRRPARGCSRRWRRRTRAACAMSCAAPRGREAQQRARLVDRHAADLVGDQARLARRDAHVAGAARGRRALAPARLRASAPASARLGRGFGAAFGLASAFGSPAPSSAARLLRGAASSASASSAASSSRRFAAASSAGFVGRGFFAAGLLRCVFGASSRRPSSTHPRLAGAGVAAEGARRRELAELVADHRLGDEHGHVLAAVVDGDRVADHLGEDRRGRATRS